MTAEISIGELSYIKSVYIGLIQAIAVIPGVSRSGATIVGGRFLGLSKEAVVEFSFLLAVPTILGATALDLYKNISMFDSSQIDFLTIGFITSFITAIISVKFLIKYIRHHSFASFGIYRIIIALMVVVLFIL